MICAPFSRVRGMSTLRSAVLRQITSRRSYTFLLSVTGHPPMVLMAGLGFLVFNGLPCMDCGNSLTRARARACPVIKGNLLRQNIEVPPILCTPAAIPPSNVLSRDFSWSASPQCLEVILCQLAGSLLPQILHKLPALVLVSGLPLVTSLSLPTLLPIMSAATSSGYATKFCQQRAYE